MKWKTILGIALIGAMFAALAWAHHAAEGIISDDMWSEIDAQLADVTSPHLDLDFEDIMATMRIEEASEGASMFLVSSITIEEDDCEESLAIILEIMNDLTLDWMHDPNGNLSGDYNNSFMPVLVPDECVCDDGECTFDLYEPIGFSCWSDSAWDIYEPHEAPGSGKSGN